MSDDLFGKGIFICMILCVFLVPTLVFGFTNLGTTEITGMVVSIKYQSWPYPHTDVEFVIYTPEGVILEETYSRSFSGKVDLKIGTIYRIRGHKDFFQWWATPLEIVEIES